MTASRDTVVTRGPRSTRRGLLLAGATLATAGCSAVAPARDPVPAPTGWTQTGGNPAGDYYTTAGGAPTDEPQVRWEVDSGTTVPTQEPVVYDGTVYPGRRTDVRIDTATGDRDRRGVRFVTTPAVAVTDSYRNATLVGLRDTIVRETISGGEQVGSFVATNTARIAGGETRRRWRYPAPGGGMATRDRADPVPPVVAGDRAVLGGQFLRQTTTGQTVFGGVVVADAGSGRVAWRHARRTDDGRPVSVSRPSVRDGRVYLGTVRGAVVGLRLGDGAVVWERSVTDEGTTSLQVVASDGVVCVVGRETVVGLDPDDGTELWRTTPPAPVELTDRQATTVGDGQAVLPLESGSAGGTQSLVALGTDAGERLWRADVPQVAGTPAVAGGVVYYSESDAVAARDLDDGRLRWRTTPGSGSAFGTPAVDETGLYVAGTDSIYALQEGA